MNREFVKNHTHISAAQMRAVNNMDADDLSYDDIALLHSVWKKADECSVCRARYDFAMESDRILTALTPDIVRVSLADRAAAILQEKFGDLETGLSEAVSRWLSGTMDLLGSLESISLRPALAGAARGLHTEGMEIHLTQDANVAQFDFELIEKTPVVFRVSRETSHGVPLCLIIIGRDDTSYNEVYPLTDPLAKVTRSGKAAKLSSPIIHLEPGKYSIIVPAI